MTTPQSIVVLGSTGSIGTSCLDVIRSHPDRMRLLGANAFRSGKALLKQAQEFQPDWISLVDEAAADGTSFDLLSGKTQLFTGPGHVERLVQQPEVDTVVSAIVGAAGLEPTLAAVEAGKRIALANKETLVVAGSIVTERAAACGATILPVDSEHSAIFQALQGGRKADLRRIILTPS
ncbi:MAG: 1-deoxy-D-xylulose-5-phosphate reductoisomerase, partial [Fuerstiella sp.]|nr:1-deoxy-D-xylulose-5-phosphate reductoisomerase [Fuerstiella sp.]